MAFALSTSASVCAAPKFGANTRGLTSRKAAAVAPKAVKGARAMAGTVNTEDVPDMGKRNVMNLLLVGALGLPGTSLLGGFAYFFVPPSAGGGGAGQAAKDANGNEIKKGSWLKTHLPGDRTLSQGLKGDATYIIVKDDGSIENYGLNAVCTHLGCVVPWNKAENKFKCPCHGSQYNNEGKVIRGPAPLSLALAHAEIDANDTVIFSPWTETDFRTGIPPWWK
eukprot:CAMPEP_0197614754 /NCGR_PEP_ID=MMETSP1326-20131121/59684_1 /TAXON_ID=1155430 /ORGANISM="Genus nov. species nov., Strain RCC2288" /LENGTH=222 /DNA_ID=CAMNT_0043183631 /DNA_START=76 /DNA_END=744 /DNA_ORIENTATION=-